MAVYTVWTRDVWVIGRLWMGGLAGMHYKLPPGIAPTREAIQEWVNIPGDFQSAIDFSASIGEVEIPWATKEGERLAQRIWEEVHA